MALAAVGQKLLWTKSTPPPPAGDVALYFRYVIRSVVLAVTAAWSM